MTSSLSYGKICCVCGDYIKMSGTILIWKIKKKDRNHFLCDDCKKQFYMDFDKINQYVKNKEYNKDKNKKYVLMLLKKYKNLAPINNIKSEITLYNSHQFNGFKGCKNEN